MTAADTELSQNRTRVTPALLLPIGIAAAFAPVAANYAHRFRMPGPSVAGVYGCFVLLLFYVVLPAISSWRLPPLRAFVLLMLPYLVYAAGTRDFRWLALGKVALIAAPVLGLYGLVPVRNPERFGWQDALCGSWLVYVVLARFFTGIWTVPVNLDFMSRLFLAALGAICWTSIRPLPSLGYRLELSTGVLAAAAKNFVFFAALAIPLGFALGFTAWHPRWRGPLDFGLSFVEIFLFIALLEEMFFRGFLQNLLAGSFGSPWRGQLIASCLFGLFHILHAPFPNWRYVILASIAGCSMGRPTARAQRCSARR